MKNNGYGKYLSEAYDTLNYDVDYAAFADFYEKCFAKFSDVKVRHVCEMACGTGNMSIELKKRGYKVTAFDISENMLTLADKKAREKNETDIRFTLQDMRSFKLYSKADAIVCMMDSVNCLTDKKDLESMLMCVNDALTPGGIFVFDVNSKRKFEEVYAENAYILEDEGVLLAWQNFYKKSTKKCDLFLSFFFEDEDGRYSRYDEQIKQRFYPVKTLEKTLLSAGFEIMCITDGFDFEKADENKCDRVFFAVKKQR